MGPVASVLGLLFNVVVLVLACVMFIVGAGVLTMGLHSWLFG